MEADGGAVRVTDGGHGLLGGLLAEVRWLPNRAWQACVAIAVRVLGDAWRRVTTLSVSLLVGGVLLVIVAEGGVWQEVGTAFIGGSVVGLVLTIAQHTLDQQAMRRQRDSDVQLAVSASSALDGIGLRGASLSEAYMPNKDFTDANLDEARLDGADLRESNLTGASLQQADLRGADLRGANLRGATFDDADLSGARLDAGLMRGTRLVGAHLVATEITTTDDDDAPSSSSERVDLSRARLDRAQLREVRLVGLRASFASATGMDATGADLRNGDFSCADLRGAGLSRADLRGCDLSGADLSGAVLAGADLKGARLVGARMTHIDLTGAIVDGADLRRADLRGAFLTNVDLESTDLTGAWVLPNDLLRATGAPTPDQLGAVVVDVEPQPDRDGGVAAMEIQLQVVERSRRRRDRARLVVTAGSADLRPTAREVARRLGDRRRGLDRVNGNVEGIVVNDAPPHAGDPDELGLPNRVRARRRLGWRHSTAVLRRHPDGIEVVVSGRFATSAGRPTSIVVPDREPDEGTQAGAVSERLPAGPAPHKASSGRVASALQFLLASEGQFLEWEEVDAYSTWLERPNSVPLVPALDDALALNPRSAVALLLRAWVREVGDAEAATRALDEVRIVWGASAPGLRRALAAARLGNLQCQLVHRTSLEEPSRLLARAQAASDASLALFGSSGDERHRRRGSRRLRQRRLALRSKAMHARAMASHVYGGDRLQPEHRELDEGIQRYRETMEAFEAGGLPVSPTIRNNLAYCLMARVGRFTTGPGQGYGEAVAQLRLVLDQFGVYEEHCTDDAGVCTICGQPLRRPFGVYQQHCLGKAESHRGDAISVQEMARLSIAGEESERESHIRRRREVRLALANLGNLYRLFKHFDAALNCYSAALYCEPQYIEAYGERAWVRLEQADVDGAIGDIGHALDMPFGTSQQKARIVLYYVDALDRVGRARDQGPWIERARRLDPESHKAKELAKAWKATFVDAEDSEG